MRVDARAWLALMNRRGPFDARAMCAHSGPDGGETTTSVHELSVDDPLRWEYTTSDEESRSRWSCDGHELWHVTDERELRTPVPERATPDEPWYFSSWLSVVDTWLVEMVRPVDLFARVLVVSLDEEDGGHLRVGAEPLGNEPSPYSGFSIPDGRVLSLCLGTELGALPRVEVTHIDGTSSIHTLSLTDRAG